MLLFTRRNMFQSTAFLLSAVDNVKMVSWREALDIIDSQTPFAFRAAVCSSGSFLYRGETIDAPQVLQPSPDLLLAGTYDDKEALRYFTCLEGRLENSGAKPSTGHIGTSKYEDAASWGPVASIWPLGTEISYVWPQNAATFYPESSCVTDYTVDRDLGIALRLGREVLFVSRFGDDNRSSSFLAIPSRYDAELQASLSFCHQS